jgi:hypothetical protein
MHAIPHIAEKGGGFTSSLPFRMKTSITLKNSVPNFSLMDEDSLSKEAIILSRSELNLNTSSVESKLSQTQFHLGFSSNRLERLTTEGFYREYCEVIHLSINFEYLRDVSVDDEKKIQNEYAISGQ